MSTKLPTLDDMLNPDKNVEIKPEGEKKQDSPTKNTTAEKGKEKEKSDKKKKKKKTKKNDKKEEHKKEDHKKEDKKEEKKEEDKKEELKKEEPVKEEKKEEDKKEEEKKEEPKKEEDKKVEEKKEEGKKEEPKKEEPKKEEDKKEEEKKEEPKKEEDKKEEPKKEEEKKEEQKKEEDKKEEPKVEGEPKEEKKEPKKPREPEPKVPTDFTELIKEINDMKQAGNDLFKQGSIDQALEKYKEAYDKLEKELPKIDKERDYNPQSKDLFTLFIQLSQNLSLCYFKTEKYEESIKLDQKIIARDNKYDKAYYRLFKSYMKLEKKAQAVYFGNILLGFDEETKKRYEDKIAEIEEAKKSLQAEYDAIKAQERKEMMKSIAKYGIPIVILIAAFAIYFFMFRKKKVAN